jgi:hypothetical protein
MSLADQSETIAFLTRLLEGQAGPDRKVEIIRTHISIILLGGERALKLKRAVQLSYVDLATPQIRFALCRKEVELNRRTAPALYLGAHKITRGSDGRLEVDGDGTLIDAFVEMRRFESSALFDDMAKRGALTAETMSDLARNIAVFHRDATVDRTVSGAAAIERVLDINEQELRQGALGAGEGLAAVLAEFRKNFAGRASLLDARAGAGKVRRCHGDLYLRNICLIDGRPTMFDCLEFDEALATIDVLYDLAFLLMDLWHRGFAAFANLVANRYFDATGDVEGMGLLPFFMAIRAAVRAHVTARQGDLPEARAYLDLARHLLQAWAPSLVAIGGWSGSGKSTVAAALAPEIGAPPGARVLNSDRLRKAMHNVAPEAKLPPSAYRPEVSIEVYRAMRDEAAVVLSAHSVVADAVFDREDERDAIAAVAAEARVPFVGLWLGVAQMTGEQRIRQRKGGPSDATVDVLRQQMNQPLGTMTWQTVDAGKNVAATVEAARRIIEPEAKPRRK